MCTCGIQLTYMWAHSMQCSRQPLNITSFWHASRHICGPASGVHPTAMKYTMLWACQPTYIVPPLQALQQQPWNITSPQASNRHICGPAPRRSSKGPYTNMYIKYHSYLQGDYYIAYYIILIIGTNITLYHKLINCLYTIPINQKVTIDMF